MRKPGFCLGENKRRRSAVTAQLISAFVIAARIVQSFLLNQKFQASRPVCVRPGWKPQDWFSRVTVHIALNS